ncbi:hypothetical protein CONPUDRAFT_165717 [Coniophora puteana RWD-64-598 SS2]|uniref:RNI-like protein n=1 Tax=Coniophora puteana (strain RWD-64-598) TaxID=741705 RepID=A0A5M3MR10_CONPW|nr:uncharacterized protein CONPUDRAFT_165717 [Coniophora puteana RWD-64-598 SS2]EIW81628.1 hypothetical protein CONPUDRAFT_165717 [Coniophora puteana RWD-64-598 SS2]
MNTEEGLKRFYLMKKLNVDKDGANWTESSIDTTAGSSADEAYFRKIGLSFAYLPALFPSLTDLRVSDLQLQDVATLSDALRSLFRLENVRVPLPNARAMTHLANLPSLRALSLDILPSTPEIQDPNVVFGDTLEDLSFQCHDLDTCANVLSTLNAAPKSLRVLLCTPESFTPRSLDHLVFAISEQLSPTRLETLHLTSSDPARALTPALFEPLEMLMGWDYWTSAPTGFHALRTLAFTMAPLATMANADVELLATSLPHLRVLRLGDVARTTQPRTTAICLVALAVWCRALEHVAIAFDARGIRDEDTHRLARADEGGGWGLRTLDVGASPIASGVDVAAYLCAVGLCPRLEAISACDATLPVDKRAVDSREWRWKAVMNRIVCHRRTEGCVDEPELPQECKYLRCYIPLHNNRGYCTDR